MSLGSGPLGSSEARLQKFNYPSVTPRELAARWRCRVSTVRAMIADGRLSAFDPTGNGRPRISFETVLAAENGALAAMRAKCRRRPEPVSREVQRILESA
jgi:excisionase family DNA binding protein